MPPPRHTAPSELTEEAIAWFVLLRSGEAGPDGQRRFCHWLARSPAHAEAYAAVQRLYSDLRQVAGAQSLGANAASLPPPGEGSGAEDSAAPHSARRHVKPPPKEQRRRHPRLLWPALGLAAAWLFAALLIVPRQYHLLDAWLGDYHTRTGEQREVRLADGSQVLLNTNSAIAVDYGDQRRRIRLLHGQARFTVAADARRPFEVDADALGVWALGTVFDVYRAETGEVSVTVQEHAVAVGLDPADGGAAGKVIVKEGLGIRYRPGGGLGRAEAVDLGQATAWQRGWLQVNDRPLAELLAELDRYRVGRVFAADPELAGLAVTGVFSLSRPDAAPEAIRKALGLRATRLGPWWVALRR